MYTPFALCGNVSMPLQWTRILSMSVTGAGSFTPVPLVEQYFTSNVFIKAGSVQGFYITLNEVGEHNINSPRPPPPHFSHLTLLNINFMYPFISYSPRF